MFISYPLPTCLFAVEHTDKNTKFAPLNLSSSLKISVSTALSHVHFQSWRASTASIQFPFIFIASLTLKIVSGNPEPDPEQAAVATASHSAAGRPGNAGGGGDIKQDGGIQRGEEHTYLSDVSNLRRSRTKTKWVSGVRGQCTTHIRHTDRQRECAAVAPVSWFPSAGFFWLTE